MNSNFVSIIIPTFNDTENLKKCLRSIQNQTYPRNRFEIVIIDNCSEQSLYGVVDSFENARLIIEQQPGSYAARNKGISEARGDLLAFTDSDAIPVPNWLEKGVHLFCRTKDCGFVAGKIDVFPNEHDKPNAIERYEKIVSHRQKDYVEKHQFGATANLFSSKQVFEKVGLFDANLKSRGDLEWGQRVAKSGYKLVYTDDAIVRHPARRSLKALFWRNVRLAGGRVDQRRQTKLPIISTRYLVNLLLPPFKEIISTMFMYNRIIKFQHITSLLGIFLFVHYVSSLETLRVLLGGKSIR